MKKTKNSVSKKKSQRKRNPIDPQSFVNGLAELFTPRVTLTSYPDMLRMCDGFVTSLRLHSHAELTPIENEMICTAADEIIDTLKDKYEIRPLDAAILLLTMGVEMLKKNSRTDTE